MSRSTFLRVQMVAASLLASSIAPGADKSVPPPPGAQIYNQLCATCHDHPQDRIPARELISKRSPDEVVQALTSGTMRTQAAGLNMNERIAVATFLTGKVPTGKLAAAPEKNRCTPSVAALPAKARSGMAGAAISTTRVFNRTPGSRLPMCRA